MRGPRRSELDLALDAGTRARAIEIMATRLAAEYVHADIGERMARFLRERQRAGAYDAIASSVAFADLLTKQLDEIAHDKHLHVDFDIEPRAPGRREREAEGSFAKVVNYGFEKAERLEGNIGYVEIRGLLDPRLAAPTARAAMAFVADTDALILDLRRNGGGEPEMVALVASYLFGKERVHLNDLRFRRGGRVDASWTTPADVPRLYGHEKPIYVLTSGRTFSGGEELAYDLQALARATIVGEVTGGGANPNEEFEITEHLSIAIPVGHAVNPVTGTSWEGIGVKPDVLVPAAHAPLTAHLLALKAELAKPHPPPAERYLRDTMDDVRAELERLRNAR